MKSRSFEKCFYYAIVSLLSSYTTWKVSKYGVISGLHFPVFGLNTGKYGPEITLYLDNFHAVWVSLFSSLLISSTYSEFLNTVPGTLFSGSYYFLCTFLYYLTLREKRSNTELFLVGIFPYLDWIQENTDQK